MLLGLIALIVVGLVLLARSLVLKKISKESLSEKFSAYLKTSAVKEFADSCLEAVAEQGLFLAALQGGVLWDSQGGTSSGNALGIEYLPAQLFGESFNVSYALKGLESADCGLKNYYKAPDYPHPNASIQDMNNFSFLMRNCYSQDAGFFGYRTAPPLCVKPGPNWIGTTKLTCVRYGLASENPVQLALKKYVESNLDKCLDFSSLEEEKDVKVVKRNNPEVEVVFSNDEVVVKAVHELSIKGGEGVAAATFEASASVKTRFKELYEYFSNLLRREFLKSSFKIESMYPSVSGFKPGFEVELRRDFCPSCASAWKPSRADDLLVIRYNASLLEGKPLTVAGVLKNRAPVLEPLKKLSFIHGFSAYAFNFVDVVAVNGSTLTLTPFAVDPDDDPVIYNYSLWLGNESETSCTFTNTLLQDFKTASNRARAESAFNALKSSCTPSKSGRSVNSWQDSAVFRSTLQNASVTLTKDDIGLHTVRVVATDGYASDYQDLTVLVVDSSQAFSLGWNVYSTPVEVAP